MAPCQKLTAAQIKQVAQNAGLNSANADIAAAIALAESGGNTCAHNTKGEDSRGLWQINVGPGANTQFGRLDLFDPDTNARVMFTLSRGGTDWGDWSTYWKTINPKTGRGQGVYLKYLPSVHGSTGAAFSDIGGTPVQLASSSSDDSGEAPGDCAFHALGVCWIHNGPARVVKGSALIVAGSLIVLTGIVLIARNTSVGQQASSIVGSVGSSVPGAGMLARVAA